MPVWLWTSRVLRSLVGIIAIALSFGVFGYLAQSREAPAQVQEQRALPIIRAVRAAPVTVERRWTGYGTARALDASDVAAEVAGRVVEVADGLEAGVAVEAGALLMRLDPRDYASRSDAARLRAESIDADLSSLEIEESRLTEQAELLADEIAVAERDLARAQTAFDRGAGNESAIDARLQTVKTLGRSRAGVLSQLEVMPSRRVGLRASLASAEADARLANDNLARTEIRAPFSGVLQEVGLEVGEWARVGDTVARVVDLSVIEIPLRLPAFALGHLRAGDSVVLKAEGVAREAWAGSVGRVAPESDASTRSATVFVEVRQRPEDQGVLRPGRFVMGEVVSSDTERALVLPRRAVDAGTVFIARALREGDPEPPPGASRPMVVERADISVSRYIEAGFPSVSPSETQWAVLGGVAVSGGVSEGSVVLTSNLESLHVGDLVDVRVETGGSEVAGDGGRP